MFHIKVKALGLDYFSKVSQQLDAENIDYTITYDHYLRGSAHSLSAHRTQKGVKNEFWACYGMNENRLAISQLAESYFPKVEHNCACNLVFPHTLIDYNPFKKGYVQSFMDYLVTYGLNQSLERTVLDNWGKKSVFSVLTIPIDSPLQYGRYKEILHQNKIYGAVCYGTNLNTVAFSGYANLVTNPNEFVYFLYGTGQNAPIIEALAQIYFDNISQVRINNLPRNSYCIPYSDVIKGYIYGLDELLIRSGVKLVTQPN